MDEMLGDYLDEARKVCQGLDTASYQVGKDPSVLKEIMRLLHTLKGSSGFMGFEGITSLCHLAEEKVSSMKEVVPGFPQFLRTLAESLSDTLDEIESTGAELPSSRERMRPLLEALSACDFSAYRDTGAFGESTGIRITPQKLDRILMFMGEAEVARHRLSAQTERMPQELSRALRELDLAMNSLRDEIMSLRMVDMGRYFRRLSVVAEELARDLGKEVSFVSIGADVKVDKAVADGIMDALVHLIRNAIDHGIEPPDDREALGKPRSGTITVETTQEGNRIRISVSDDGAGVDTERLRRKAREIYPNVELDEPALLSLLFKHGFTTKDEAGEISGRGIGLDVVKESAERVGGNVYLETEHGRGTRITLDLPLTLLVTPLAFIRACGETFAFPLSAIVRVDWMEDVEVFSIGEKGFIKRDGRSIPLVSMSELLGKASEGDMIIIMRRGVREFALLVDEFVGEGKGVIRPIRGAAGNSVIGAITGPDGTPILVLEPGFFAEKGVGIG
ncbi:MAG: ATP-binding protein [candidate division WOR-3 bacterium]